MKVAYASAAKLPPIMVINVAPSIPFTVITTLHARPTSGVTSCIIFTKLTSSK
ncbi:hypothetical protein CHS0354_016825, partial [Potamilus streckersoni]